jgi:uncharacterized protein (DUF2062 family)
MNAAAPAMAEPAAPSVDPHPTAGNRGAASAPVSLPMDSAPAPRPSFWQRRLVAPLRAQLVQGVAPDRLALTLGVGTACSLFPFFGFTALLNLGVGFALRLNHPILQTLNQLLGPVQLALIVVHVRLGEVIWQAPEGSRFTVGEMLAAFQGSSFAEFLARFGWAGLHALTAWLITAPFVAALLAWATRPALRRLVPRPVV